MKIDAKKVLLILAERQMNRTELASLSGISRQSVSTILTRGTCDLKSSGKIAKALELPVSEIMKEE